MSKSRVGVQRRKNEPFQKFLNRFKRKVAQSEHLDELKDRRYYTKPTTIRRRKKQLAIRENEKLVKIQKELDRYS